MKSNYLNKALYEASNLNPREEFTISDLYKGYIWKRIPKDVRKCLGQMYYLILR